MPKWLADFLRRAGTFFFVPLIFSYLMGYSRSSFRQLAIYKGRYVPWFTFPAIDALMGADLQGMRVLEFGGGASTVFFIEMGCSVICFEEEDKWIDFINMNCRKPHMLSAIKRKVGSFDDIKGDLGPNPCFDLIVIDAHARADILMFSPGLLAKDGIIIIDNSEGYNTMAVLDNQLFKDFNKVDYYGFAPGVILRHATSVLFRRFEQPRLYKSTSKIHDSEFLNKA